MTPSVQPAQVEKLVRTAPVRSCVGRHGGDREPLAWSTLAAACEQAGHDAMILDLRLHPEPARADSGTRTNPTSVGVTGYSMHVIRNLEILAGQADPATRATRWWAATTRRC